MGDFMVAFMLVFTVCIPMSFIHRLRIFHFGQLVYEFMVAFVLVFTVFRTTVNSDFVFPSIA